LYEAEGGEADRDHQDDGDPVGDVPGNDVFIEWHADPPLADSRPAKDGGIVYPTFFSSYGDRKRAKITRAEALWKRKI
jgi:hypothetical protein